MSNRRWMWSWASGQRRHRRPRQGPGSGRPTVLRHRDCPLVSLLGRPLPPEHHQRRVPGRGFAVSADQSAKRSRRSREAPRQGQPSPCSIGSRSTPCPTTEWLSLPHPLCRQPSHLIPSRMTRTCHITGHFGASSPGSGLVLSYAATGYWAQALRARSVPSAIAWNSRVNVHTLAKRQVTCAAMSHGWGTGCRGWKV